MNRIFQLNESDFQSYNLKSQKKIYDPTDVIKRINDMLEDRDTDKLKRKRDEPVKKNKPRKDKNEKSKKFLKKSDS